MNNSGLQSIVFTICSNNYLAQARTLKESLLRFNPGTKFLVALVDLKSLEIDYSLFEDSDIIELNDTIIPAYQDMISRYSIIEINTAVKPFFFEYLIRTYPEYTSLFYFDPDMFIYDSLEYLRQLFRESDIIITPHFLTPLPVDHANPAESMVLNYGIYNLGFIGIKVASNNSALFLKWWGERTFNFGYFNTCQGLFVDQIWINLATVYFSKVHVITHFGCNMGPWNLHERKITAIEDDGRVMINNEQSLIFYHFSSFNFRDFYFFSPDYNRFSLSQFPLLKKLYQAYGESMTRNRADYYSQLRCQLKLVTSHPPLKSRIVKPVLDLLKMIWKKI